MTGSKHITYIIVQALVGILSYLPCHAQDSNMKFWSQQEQSRRNMLRNYQPEINIIFQSRVVSDSSLISIRDCNIVNVTQRYGTTSDAYGDFKITASVNDSISFSALGYEKRTIVLTESMYNYGYVVELKPKAYELNEVTIQHYRFDFKPPSRFEIYTPPLPNQGGINIPISISPVTALYNLLSVEGKQKRYHISVVEGTAEYIRVGEKFNGEMVAQITGLKDDELIKFMTFCNFSNEFLLNYSQETINRAIRQKYKEWSSSK